MSDEAIQSFADRKAQQLRREFGADAPNQPESNDPTPESAELESLPGEDQPDDRQPEGGALEEPTGQPDSGPDAGADQDEPPPWAAREQELLKAAEEAEARRRSMEQDYRRKTQNLSDAMKAVREQAQQAEESAQYMARIADSGMAQFQNVDWEALKTDPVRYQEASRAYQQALQQQQARHTELRQIREWGQQQQEKNRQYQAEHSKGVLRHVIPNWGNELYGELREFAEQNYDLTGDEFDNITDWRPMAILHDAMKARKIANGSGEVMSKIGRKSARPHAAANKAPQPRDEAGKYRKARAEAMANPGEKGRFAAMKAAQIRAERDKNR